MSYVLGSAGEAIAFTEDGIEYRPTGPVHAVDLQSSTTNPDVVLAYAICGEAVRVWSDQPFDPHADDVHERCGTLVRGDSHELSEPSRSSTRNARLRVSEKPGSSRRAARS